MVSLQVNEYVMMSNETGQRTVLLYTGLILITSSDEEKRDIKLRKNIGGKEVKEYNFECIFKSKPISPVFRLNIYIYIYLLKS